MNRALPIAIAALLFVPAFMAARLPAQALTTGANLARRPDAWFTSDEGIQQVDRIISWQRPEGGWEKGYDSSKTHESGKPFGEWDNVGTIDNGLTYTELRDLSRAYNLTHKDAVRDAVLRGIDFLLIMQFETGGWPQRYPLPNNYGRNITFNDDAMVNVMRLLRDIATDKDKQFSFVDADRRAKAQKAFDRGIDCILKSQIVVNGAPMAWPQQCDPQTLAPVGARTYELPSISGSESAGVIRLLMSLENPSPQVQRAVHTSAAWYEKSKIIGKRLERTNGDIVVVDDPAAPALWARFYEIDTNRPFYCGRDGIKKYSLAEIEKERRTGYAWLRDWGSALLGEYAQWAKKYPSP